MPNYQTNNRMAGTAQNITTTAKTIVQLASATARLVRGRAYDLIFATDGTPSDFPVIFDAARQTTAGTSTSATPSPLDPGDPASAAVAVVNSTVEPTTGVVLLDVALNARASYRWVAAPGSELVWPGTNLAGVGVRAKGVTAGYASTVAVTFFHNE